MENSDMALIMEESKTVHLGVCKICHFTVTAWDEHFGMLGAKFEGEGVSHDACTTGKLAVSC